MTATYFGHSAVQIQAEAATLLIDPFITGNGHAEGVVSADDLNPDVVLLTHAHADHVGDTPSILSRTGAQLIAQYEIVVVAGTRWGHENSQPMNTGGTFETEWGRVTNTFARHSSSFDDGTYGGLAGGFVIQIGDTTVYHAGDTALFNGMRRIGDEFDIDLAFLPVGDVLTMGYADAITAAQWVQAKTVVPIHWGTFPFLNDDPDAFAEQAAASGVNVQVLRPGESLQV